MIIKDITNNNREEFNSIVNHPLQSFEWGEFREKTGIKVIRRGVYEKDGLVDAFQLTIHKIPHVPFNVGYLPKGNLPSKEIIEELVKIGQEENCIFIQLEPNLIVSTSEVTEWAPRRCIPSAHPLFSKYTFILDITKSEDELLKNMQSKTRYNIKVAQKHQVKIIEDDSDGAFQEYLKLTEETIKRQGFFAHTSEYHKKMWEILGKQKTENRKQNELRAYLLLAKYNPPSSVVRPLTLVAWVLFVFHDTLYYPYGASSNLYRSAMASNSMMWEAIKFGKKMGLKKFDMWGSLGPNPNKNDPWYGFHRFKEGYGSTLTEFVGSYDLIIKPLIYQAYKLMDKARWTILKFKK